MKEVHRIVVCAFTERVAAINKKSNQNVLSAENVKRSLDKLAAAQRAVDRHRKQRKRCKYITLQHT